MIQEIATLKRSNRACRISNELSRIKDPIRGFLTYLDPSLSLNTKAAYARHLSSLAKFLRDADLITATREDLSSYLFHLREHGKSPATRAQCINALRKFYGYTVQNNLRADNPAKLLIRPRCRKLSAEVTIRRFLYYLNCESALSKGTQAVYRQRIADLARFLSPAHLLTANSDQLTEYLSYLRLGNTSPGYRGAAVGIIQRFYRYAILDDLRTDNPSTLLERPRKGERPLLWRELMVVYRAAASLRP